MPKDIARLSPAPLSDQEITDFHEIIMSAAKKCNCCGIEHVAIPGSARHSDDDCYGGYYWECSCGSTLFVPESRVGVAA